MNYKIKYAVLIVVALLSTAPISETIISLPTDSGTVFGPRPIYSPGGAIKVIVDDFKGSWAGAMGQNQFMPSSFLAYAQDFDNDGKKNIWTNEADALASIARYLKGVGSNKWNDDFTWGREVIPPSNIESIEPDLFIKRTKGCLAVKRLSKKLPSILPLFYGKIKLLETNHRVFEITWLCLFGKTTNTPQNV